MTDESVDEIKKLVKDYKEGKLSPNTFTHWLCVWLKKVLNEK